MNPGFINRMMDFNINTNIVFINTNFVFLSTGADLHELWIYK